MLQVTDVDQLQKPAVALWLYPAAGMQHLLALAQKIEVKTLPCPLCRSTFQRLRTAWHQIVQQQAQCRPLLHRRQAMVQCAVHFKHLALIIEPQLQRMTARQGRNCG